MGNSLNPEGQLKRSCDSSVDNSVPNLSHVCCVLSHFSRARLFVTLWTITHQALLSMGFSRQGYWSGLPCLPLGDLPNPRIKPTFLIPPALADRFSTTGTTWEAHSDHRSKQNQIINLHGSRKKTSTYSLY